MNDREKVLTWLEICGKNNDCSGCCPYSENGFGEYGQCRESLMADAYDMLKEQEAVEPTLRHGGDGIFVWTCGSCGAYMYHINGIDKENAKEYAKYCRQCGRKVKWE